MRASRSARGAGHASGHAVGRVLWRVVGAALVVGATGCEINTDPKPPRWETEVNVPLLNRLHPMEELIGQNAVLVATEESGLLGFRVEGDTVRANVGDSLDIDPFQGSFHDSLGAFDVRDPGEEETAFRLGTLCPAAEALHGTVATVPGFAFADVEASLGQFGTFVSVTLAAGTLTATLANQTQVPIEVTELALVDEGSGTPVATLSFASLDPGESDAQMVDLAGAVFSNQLLARVSGTSPGSGGDVMVDANAGLGVRGGLSGLRASAATAQVPATDFGFQDGVDLPPDMVVESAELTAGTLEIDFASEIPLGTQLAVTFSELTAPGGAPLTVALDLGAGEAAHREVSLAGYELTPAVPPGGGPQRLSFAVDATTVDTGSQEVAVRADDSLHVEVHVHQLALEEVTGVLTGTTVYVPAVRTEVGLPEDLGDLEGIELQQASLELVLHTTIQFPMDVNLMIEGRGHDGLNHQLPVRESFPAAGDAGDRELRLVLDETNSDILGLLNSIPEEVEIRGQVILGDGVASATARRTDSLEGVYVMSTALRLAIPAQTLRPAPARIEIEPKDGSMSDAEGEGTSLSGDVTQYLLEGGIQFTVESHIPLGLSVMVNLGTDSAAVYTDPQVTLGPVTVPAGTIDPVTGMVTASAIAATDLTLTGQDLELFKNDSGTIKRVFLGTELVLPGTGGQPVGLRASDFVHLSAMAHLRTEMNPQDWGD